MIQTTNLFRLGWPRRLFASILAVCMVFTMSPPIMAAQTSVTDGGESEIILLSGFAQLAEEVAAQSVPMGTSSVKLNLPGTLEATAYTVSNSIQPPMEPKEPDLTATEQRDKSVPESERIVENHVPSEAITVSGVVWDTSPEYDSKIKGIYIFTAVLPDGYIVEDGVSLPTITVTVDEIEDETEQSAVDKVIAMIDALPSMDEWMAMEESAARGVMNDILAAKTPYDKLSDDEKAQIDEARTAKLTELAEMAAGLGSAMPMAVGDFFEADVTRDTETTSYSFRVLTEPNGNTNGTVEIYKEDGAGNAIPAFEPGWVGRGTIPVTITNPKTGITYNVTEIGKKSYMMTGFYFYDLVIPGNVTSIGEKAFSGGSFTGALDIKEGVKTIGASAFWSCKFTGTLTLPNTLVSIGENAFVDNNFTGTLTIPDSVKTIDKGAFQLCGFSGDLVIPNGVTTIKMLNFNVCPNLTSVTMPNVTSIDDWAFMGCTSLTTIKLGATPPTVGTDVFKDCPDVRTLVLVDENGTELRGLALASAVDAYKMDDDGNVNDNLWYGWTIPERTVTFLADITVGESPVPCQFVVLTESPDGGTTKGTVQIYKETRTPAIDKSSSGKLTIPTTITNPKSGITYNVTEIGEDAFYGCGSLSGDLVIPDSVTTIGVQAFMACGFTGALTIPNSVTSIGIQAFAACGFTGTLTIPNSVDSIGEGAFVECVGFTGDLVISNNVTSINRATFAACAKLASVSMPNVTSIGEMAFHSCASLTTIKLGATPPAVGAEVFTDCPDVRTLVLIDENGTELTDSDLIEAITAYKAVDDGNTTDDLWYGWTIPEAPALPTYTVTITPQKDDATWTDPGKTYKLSKDHGANFITDLTAVVDGEYDIYEGNINTGKKVTVNGVAITAIMDYYTVTFYDNTTPYATPAPQIVLKDSKAAAPTPPTKTGYTLAKWVTANSGTTEFVFASEAITTKKDVYASWTANPYTVTFDYQGGTGTPPTKMVTFDALYGELPTPGKTGYTFKGWYTAATEGTKVEAATAVTATTSHTLYARWADEIAPSAPVLQTGTILPTDWTKAQTTIPLTLADNVGVAQLWVKVDTAEFVQVTAFTSGNTTYVYPTAEGAHTYQFKAIDAAGNEETSAEFTVKLDTAAPVVDMGNITVTNGSKDLWNWIIGQTSLMIKVPVSDETSGVKSVSYTATPDRGATITGAATLTDGKYEIALKKEFSGTVKLTATDNTDNATGEISLTAGDAKIVAEDTAPTITITEPDTGKNTDDWYSAAFDLNVTVADGVNDAISGGIKSIVWKLGNSGMETTVSDLPGTAAIYNKTFQIKVSTDGTHTYLVKATDNAGNETAWQEITVKLDRVKPGTPTVAATVDGATYDDRFTAKTVTLTATAAAETLTSGITLQYKIGEGEWQAYAAAIDHSTNTSIEGLSYTFRTLSGAGIASEEKVVTVKRQALPDEVLNNTDNKYALADITMSGTPNGEGWHDENVTVTVRPKDTIIDGKTSYTADTYYTIDNGTPAKLATPWTISVTGDKSHTLEIWTQDVASNETTRLPVTVKIDTTVAVISNPLTPSVEAEKWTNDDITVSFDASDATSGIASVQYKKDDGLLTGCTPGEGKYTFIAPENDTYTVIVTDNAGTITERTIMIENIDKTAPVIDITSTFDSEQWYGATEVIVEVTDADSGVDTSTVSGGKFIDEDIKAAGKFTATETVAKSYTYTVTATDKVGNSAVAATVTISLDSRIDIFLDKMSGKSESTDFSDLAAVKVWYDSQNAIVQSHIKSNDQANDLLDKLHKWLELQAQAAADALGEAVKNADTIEKIEQVQKDYDAFPDDIKKSVSAEIVKALDKKSNDADEAQKVIEQLKNAAKDIATYEEKQSAKEAYEKLTDDQKTLVPEESVGEYDSIQVELTAIDRVLDLLKGIKKPYTPDTVGKIEEAETAFDYLSTNNKTIFPVDEKDRLDKLTDMASHATTVKDLIDELAEEYNNTNDVAIKNAKTAYDKLTGDEKSLIDSTLKTKLDGLYQTMLDDKTAEEKAKMEEEKKFIDKVNDTTNHPTLDKINELITAKDKLSDGIFENLINDVKSDYNNLVASKDVINALGKIDLSKLTPADIEKVGEVLDAYKQLNDGSKKLVDKATDGKPDILLKALGEIIDVINKINDIPKHNTGSHNPVTGAPDLGKCDSQTPEEGGSRHDYKTHRAAVETAEIAYERLSDVGRRLISEDAKATLNGKYAGLMTYLEYINTAKTTSTSVEVAGLAENVQLPADSYAAAKTLVFVEMKDERPKLMPPTPVEKTEALSVDIKLVAEIYNNREDNKPSVTENIQPATGKKVLIKLKIPAGFQNDTLELWHVKDNGARSRITNFWLVTESEGVYGVFEVSSFSHFVLFGESQSSGGSTSSTPQLKILASEHGYIEITPKQPYIGDTVTITPKPDKDYELDKIVVTDNNGKEIPMTKTEDGKFTFTQLAGGVTIIATFKPKAPLPFIDVQTDDWFYDSVKYTFDKGLMKGTSDTTFSPNDPTRRGMIATILHRMDGTPNVDSPSFSDVESSAYYANGVAWAQSVEVVKGYDNGNFGPNNNITREQFASILYRYAKLKNYELGKTLTLDSFADSESVSAYAKDALRWAVGNDILSGRGNNTLAPTATATRAEVATILLRFTELFLK